MKRSRIALFAVSLISVLLVAAISLGAYYGIITKRTLHDITTPDGPETVLAVYVLQEDPAQSAADLAGYVLGMSRDDRARPDVLQLLDQLEKGTGEKQQAVLFENWFALADGLREQACQAMILEEAFMESLTEADGYSWLKEGVRQLETFTFSQEDKKPAADENEPVAGESPEEDGAAESDAPIPPDRLPARFLVYISGIDTFGGISARSRSDVNILAAVNTDTRQILLLSTPRDYYVAFNASKGSKDKLTHAGLYGIGASMDALERLYNVEIDYYLRLNFSGFVKIIDALGGVDVYSDSDFSVAGVRDYHKGYNRLNGTEALAFARERYSFSGGDYQRASNQMEVIKAVLKKCTSVSLLKNYGEVMKGIAGSFQTNMPEEQIVSLVKMQLSDRRDWETESYTSAGINARRQTYSIPGRELFVILPDKKSVAAGQARLREILER